MCGIVGYFKPENSSQHFDLDGAAHAIRHRGPNGRRDVRGESYHVAFNRLSINDLRPQAMQPFRLDGVTAFVNGEIYNHIELKEKYRDEFHPETQCDAEIIPFLYRRFGLSFLNQINGMFAMVLIDERTHDHFLIIDRFGVKPMYYLNRNGTLFFASEMKALLQVLDLEIDKRNLNIAFNLNYISYPYSPFKDLMKVTPGSYLHFNEKGLKEHRWYFMRIKDKIEDMSQIEEGFVRHFEKSIRYRLRADVPVGAYLSGGLDSSSIAVTAAKFYHGDFHVFNGLLEGKEFTTDYQNAVRLARDKGLAYHPVKIDRAFYEKHFVACAANFDEILFEAGTLSFYAVLEEAKKYVTVLLDGIGGDELFCGYPKYVLFNNLPQRMVNWANRLTPQSPALRRLLTKINRKGSKLYDLMLDKHLFFIHAQELIPAGFFGRDSHYDESFLLDLIHRHLQTCQEAFQNDSYNYLGYLDFFNITGQQNVFSDRVGMASSIEGRNPYEDYELVEFAFSIPTHLKIDRSLTKKLFRKLHSRILPDYIINAPKCGFGAPMHLWLFNSNLHKVLKKYIDKNKEVIIDIIGQKAFQTIMNYKIYRGTGNRWHMFLAYILWHKFNVEKIKLNDVSIPLRDFCSVY